MKTNRAIGMIAIIGAIILSGCASQGNFKYQNVGQLEIGKTRDTDCEGLFGKPDSVEKKNAPEGEFKMFTYGTAAIGVGYQARWRKLLAEFRNGVLNAYIYFENYEKTSMDTSRLTEIKSGVSKKEDVLRALGKPNTEGKCPSYLLQEMCDKGSELWVWSSSERGFNAKAKSVIVAFDMNGVVTFATEEASTANRR